MKLPSYLVKNRLGIFCFRITYFNGTQRKEKRWSLRTRNPVEAKRISLQLSATLRENSASQFPGADVHRLNLQTIRSAEIMKDNGMMYLTTIISSPKGGTISLKVDQSDPKDIAAAEKLTKVFYKEEAKFAQTQSLVEAKTTNISDERVNIQPVSGSSCQELIERFKSRNKGELGQKTLYEYERMQLKFADWLTVKKQTDNFPISKVTREDIANFIDDTKRDGISLQTIQKKYLAAISGLFSLAQSMGTYPNGDLPTTNHKIFTQRHKRKAKAMSGWRLFDDDELVKMFSPENLLVRKKPCDFWLPLLGLFTGGRISELCQLKVDDILEINGIWTIDINADDEDQSVKTTAGIRKIPLHPQLIQLGFLDYLEDVRPYGGTIFPYMTADSFNNYSKTPSRRFGEYLDGLGIDDPHKVFHSFRSTSNNRLKQNGVPEESRCQFIGHEHDTVNSKTYSDAHELKYLLDNVASQLSFPAVDFSKLEYPRAAYKMKLTKLMAAAHKLQAHKEAKLQRDNFY